MPEAGMFARELLHIHSDRQNSIRRFSVHLTILTKRNLTKGSISALPKADRSAL